MRPYLRLLGGFRLNNANGEDVHIPGRKARALLAYLALTPGTTHSREKLATLLWGDRMDEQARHSLRQALSALRGSLDFVRSDPFSTGNETAALNAGVLASDVTTFESHAGDGTPQGLEEAAGLYGGPLLEGLRVDAEDFNGWLAGERDRLHTLACDVLERLAAHQEKGGAAEQAIATAKGLLSLDPAREEGHRQLMRLYARGRRRAEALRQFRACEDALRRELNAEPSAETVKLFISLRDERAAPTPAAPPAPIATSSSPPLSADSPVRPSVAVLPFANLSGDPEQDPFVRGFTSDLITDLSRVPQITVRARASTLPYDGRQVDPKVLGRELGVGYVLQGSIRNSGSRIRINVQLLEAATGSEIWAERFDRTLDDIFKVQDEINQSIIAALDVMIIEGEQARLWRRSTHSPEAYDIFLRARFVWQGSLTHRACQQAKQYLERALEIDPAFVRALTTMGALHIYEGAFGWSPSLERSLATACGLAKRAIALDKSQTYSYTIRALCHLYRREFAKALKDGERAVHANPTGGLELAFLGNIQMYAGQTLQAVDTVREGIRLTPAYPSWYQMFLGQALFGTDSYEEAFDPLRECQQTTPGLMLNRLLLVCCTSALGMRREAHAAAEALSRMEPSFGLRRFTRRALPYRNGADLERVLALAREAGLPD